MTRWDFRSLLNRTFVNLQSGAVRSLPGRVRALAGRALGVGGLGVGAQTLELLEERKFLDGGFGDAVLVTLDGTGRGAASGAIDPAVVGSDNDYFQFAAAEDGFVSVLADTQNEGAPTTLDTRVTVFNSSQVQIASGTNNGTLTSGLAKDGWVGFIATAGQSYFVVVSRETGSGGYTLQVNAENIGFEIEDTGELVEGFTGIAREAESPIPDGLLIPITPIQGTLEQVQQDIVYRYDVPDDEAFDSIVTINAQVTQNDLRIRLDSRIDVYRQTGTTPAVTRVAFDSDAGRINDAFTTIKAAPGETYFIRIRSDELTQARVDLGTGTFFLVLDGVATELPMNPVTRRGNTADAFVGFGDPTAPPPDPFPEVAPPTFQVNAHVFEAQGNGLTITNATGAGLDPIVDPAMALFDTTGRRIAFNDNFVGNNPQFEIQLQGGNGYFVVVDGFNINGGTQYNLFNESNHTFDASQPNDDHINTPANPLNEDGLRQFGRATPLVFGAPFHTLDGNGNLVRDIGMRVTAGGTGRIHAQGDTDVFKVTVPVNQQGTYAGNNDDTGGSLFVGGAFTRAGIDNVYPTVSRNLAVWDANDYWYTGQQTFDPADGTQYGFTDNVATPGTDGAIVLAAFDWDPTPGEDTAPQGMTDHVLVVGGDFTLTIPGLFGPIVMQNIAIWVQDFNTGEFGWSNALGDLDGPVRAVAVIDEPAPAGGGDDPDPYLMVGGDFTGGAAIFDGAGFIDIGLGAGSRVNAITSFDAPDPGPGGPGVNEVQQISMTGSPNGGTFVLSFQGSNTPPLPFNATSAAVQAALEALPTIGNGNVTVSGGPLPANPILVEFVNDLGEQNVLPLGGNGNNLNPVQAELVLITITPGFEPIPDVEDPPLKAYLGGEFTGTDARALDFENIASFSLLTGVQSIVEAAIDPAAPDAWAEFGIIDGPVHALTTFSDPSWDPTIDDEEAADILVIGGEFADAGGTAVSNIIAWGYTYDAAIADLDEIPVNEQFIRFDPDAMEGGVNGPVFALTTWNPPEINLTPDNEARILVVGGEFGDPDLGRDSNIDSYDGLAWDQGFFEAGTDAPVRTLAAVLDDQEVLVADDLLGGTDQQEVLYVGGEFDNILLDQGPPLLVNKVAQYSAFHSIAFNVDFFSWAAQAGGVANDVEADFGPTTGADAEDPAALEDPAVHALAFFDDGNPLAFDRHDRPSSRMDLVVNNAFGGTGNLLVRVFDSNGALVYDFGRPGSDDRNPFNDPTDDPGMWDPSVLTPAGVQALQQFLGIPVWGGETYYIEVSRGGTGRYTLTTTFDANPTDLNDDGIFDHVNGSLADESSDGDFTRALDIDTTIQTGDGSNDVAANTEPFHGNETRTYQIAPTNRTSIAWSSDIGNINTIDDTDLYSFRAEFTGTVEIRIQTRGITVASGEQLNEVNAIGEVVSAEFNGLTKTIRSSLDSVLRAFNNDFVQIGYNDDNYAVRGDFSVSSVGADAGLQFTRNDARLVLNVVAGNLYYVQVESGQFHVDGSAELAEDRTENIEREIDWGRATGAYRLVLHQMPDQANDVVNGVEVVDDHTDVNFALSTVIAMGQIGDGQQNGLGSITGRILNMNTNAIQVGGQGRDSDLFRFTSPGSGAVTVRVTPTSGNLLPEVEIFADNAPFNPGAGVATGQTQQDGSVLVTLEDVFAGQRFSISVLGGGGTQGTYRIDVTTPAAVDDHADQSKWASATDLNLRDFLGIGTASGRIEVPGDTDVFRFSALDYSTLTLDVVSESEGMDPFVEVYEVSEDAAGHALFLRIAQNDDANPNTLDSRVRFPVTPSNLRVIDLDPAGAGPEDRTYPFYYVVVRSFDPAGGIGDYTVNVQFAPTDDYADGDTDADGVLDTGEFEFAHSVSVDNVTGAGEVSGVIEVDGDSDLFQFVAPASGVSTLILSVPEGGTLRGRVSLLDETAAVIATATADDFLGFNIAFFDADLDRGTTYRVVVEGFEDDASPNVETTVTGSYVLSIVTPPSDDYPNIREFPIAATVALSGTTGEGRVGGTAMGDPSNALITPSVDTDLFTFTTILAGNVTITATPFNSITGRFGARLRIFDDARNLISDTSAAATGTPVSALIAGAGANVRYYVLVSAVAGLPGSTGTGEYALVIAGATPTQPPPPDDPAAIDFNSPQVVTLDGRTGDAKINSAIDVVNDRDLYKFTPLSSGRTFLQLVTPAGSVLRGSLRLQNAPNEDVGSQVAFDSAGIPGAIANIAFDAVAGQDYWLIADGLGDSTGGYTLCVNTIPTLNRLYFPEGFSTSQVREFVSIVNPNAFEVSFTVRLKYENASIPETVIAGNRIGANSRDGLTLTNAQFYQTPGLVLNQAYSVVIESSAPLGATLAHYDFGTAIGDSFTESVSRSWSFAQVERREGTTLDFIVFHNPSPFDIVVTLTAYQSGAAPVSVRAVYFADRRGGFALNGPITDYLTGQAVTLPTGDFGIVLTAVAADPANDAAFGGIIASLSHYNTSNGSGFAVLGDPDGGSKEGVITNVTRATSVESRASFFNPSSLPATLVIVGRYMRTDLPSFSLTRQIPALGQLILTGADLGLVSDQPAGLTYSSDIAISAAFSTTQSGDADGVNAADQAGTNYFFGDAFIDVEKAGTQYFETLFFHNPSSVATDVTVKLLFLDGTTETFNVAIAGSGFAEVKLHDRPEIVESRTGYQWFAVDASAATPFVLTMTHYDLFLGGGWATQGTPFGVLNDLSRIS